MSVLLGMGNRCEGPRATFMPLTQRNQKEAWVATGAARGGFRPLSLLTGFTQPQGGFESRFIRVAHPGVERHGDAFPLAMVRRYFVEQVRGEQQ